MNEISSAYPESSEQWKQRGLELLEDINMDITFANEKETICHILIGHDE